VEWPLDYPGDVPADSYLFRGDSFDPLVGAIPTEGRTALVACGSNASPDRLRQKFARSDTDPAMAVVRSTVGNAASVYSRHVSRYGAIPATLTALAGATTELFVQYVDDEQLQLIAHSERRSYRLVELDPAVHPVILGTGDVVARCWCFASTFGALQLDGSVVGLAAFPTAGLPAMSHPELWAEVARRWQPTHSALPTDPAEIIALVADAGPTIRAAFESVSTPRALGLATRGSTPSAGPPR
jgi:hypothetical protein